MGKSEILLIDDSEDDRRLVERLLGAHFEVTTVADWVGATGILFKADCPIELVLIDMNMPVIPGDVVADVIKRRRVNPPKIVLFSAMDEDELKMKAKQVGADGYIQKQFAREFLVSEVGRFL